MHMSPLPDLKPTSIQESENASGIRLHSSVGIIRFKAMYPQPDNNRNQATNVVVMVNCSNPSGHDPPPKWHTLPKKQGYTCNAVSGGDLKPCVLFGLDQRMQLQKLGRCGVCTSASIG
jgi:hypothetical protein